MSNATKTSASEMTTVESARALRVELRQVFGRASKLISVRSDSGTLRVTVRSLGIDISEVCDVARKYRDVSYDYATGEALVGGRFVFVSYASRLPVIALGETLREIEDITADWAA